MKRTTFPHFSFTFLISHFSFFICIATPMQAQNMVEQLAGDWTFTASNNGVEVAPGIYSAGTDNIAFTAKVSADGNSLECHADAFYKSKEKTYPADWRIVVESDGAGKHRIGWVLDAAQPFSSQEFLEARSSYLEDGFWYWGGTEGGHRYMYLLADNADLTAITGMTFWSGWMSSDATEYSLSNEENNARKMYLAVSETIPYASNVGWLEIWSSPKVIKGSAASVTMPTTATGQPAVIYDLQGRRIDSFKIQDSSSKKGLYIVNGKKYVRH